MPVLVAAWVAAGLAPFWEDWDQPLPAALDLLVGVAFLVLAGAARRPAPGASWLSVAVALTWWCGTVAPAATFWHRTVLGQLLLTFPLAWVASRRVQVAVVIGYGAVLVPVVWETPVVAFGLAAALLAVVVLEVHGATGRSRQLRTSALRATVLFSGAIMLGAAAHAALGPPAALPLLVTYDTALVTVAVVLALGLRRRDVAAVSDLMVELGARPDRDLASGLGRLLGDPGLVVGYWDADARAYARPDGSAVDVAGSRRSATYVATGDRPFLVLLHAPGVFDDPGLLDVVTQAATLTTENARLRTDAERSLEDVAASRRRLVLAESEELHRLGALLDEAVIVPLADVDTEIALRAVGLPEPTRDVLSDVRARIGHATTRLRRASGGLQPVELQDGLASGLRAIAERSTLPVELRVAGVDVSPAVGQALYYVCAEAVNNAMRHSGATSVRIDVEHHDGDVRMLVADDGRGGAVAVRGHGIAGLADRVEALGGTLRMESPTDGGTRVSVEVPRLTD
ncbi:sensor histidine kinase [Cellulomonas sp. P5_C6]